MKYLVVTGGVVSGLGKGITISSLGVLLKSAGLRVTSIKIDPYLVRGARGGARRSRGARRKSWRCATTGDSPPPPRPAAPTRMHHGAPYPDPVPLPSAPTSGPAEQRRRHHVPV